MEHKEGFRFTYSAARQQEVEHIRKKYLPQAEEENKMEQLRKLHHSASEKAQARAIAVGTMGALMLGIGMSLCMTDLGAALGDLALLIGIFAGLAGILLVALAYPVYNRVLKKQRQRIAPQILRLSEELLK
jgi:uncharacterized membrane protein HdeD (DUF308 family)